MKKVLVFGTFDGLHSGHLSLFKQAKNFGDYLVVVVARDETVKKIKNHFSSRDEIERLKVVQECKLVNEVRLGYKNNPYQIIRKIRPDIICLGYDQRAFTKNLPKELEKMGLKTKIYRMKPYQPEKYHSLIINTQIKLQNAGHKIYSSKS